MALSPKEAKDRESARYGTRLKEFETKLDLELDADGGTFAIPQQIPYNVLLSFLQRYKALGWTVRIVSDQRDGDYIKFTA